MKCTMKVSQIERYSFGMDENENLSSLGWKYWPLYMIPMAGFEHSVWGKKTVCAYVLLLLNLPIEIG